MNNAEFQGVILAAGRGSRMAPFSENYPKPLLPICNKPLIVYQIEAMRDLGIRDIVVLVGHKGFEISKALGDGSQFGISIKYVEQTSVLGIAHAVGCLESRLDRPFLMFLGDIFFVPGDMQQLFSLFKEQSGGAVLGTKEEPHLEAIRRNYSVVVNSEGFAVRVVEKPRHPISRLKGVGLYVFDLTVFDAIRRTPRTAIRDEYEITDSIQVMIQDGLPVRPCNCVLDDINLTAPADLLYCNLMHASKLPNSTIIGPNCFVHEGARIETSVVGRNVTIHNAISIQNSVVFDETDVKSQAGFNNFILTPNGAVDCNHDIEERSKLWVKSSSTYV